MRKNDKKYKFSVIMSVYIGTEHGYLRESISSTVLSIKQSNMSINDVELIIGVDGPVSDGVLNVLHEYCAKYDNIKIASFASNRGLGPVLNDLISLSAAPYCIRMDDDDIMSPNRMSECYRLHYEEKYELVSSDILEFQEDHLKPQGVRKCVAQLRSWNLYFRNPLNHVATSFCKSAITRVGGYRSVKSFEDWNLWMRCKDLSFEKSKENLVYVRVNTSMAQRRIGINYVWAEVNFLMSVLRISRVGFVLFLVVLPLRVGIRLLPSGLYLKLMNMFLRRSV